MTLCFLKKTLLNTAAGKDKFKTNTLPCVARTFKTNYTSTTSSNYKLK